MTQSPPQSCSSRYSRIHFGVFTGSSTGGISAKQSARASPASDENPTRALMLSLSSSWRRLFRSYLYDGPAMCRCHSSSPVCRTTRIEQPASAR